LRRFEPPETTHVGFRRGAAQVVHGASGLLRHAKPRAKAADHLRHAEHGFGGDSAFMGSPEAIMIGCVHSLWMTFASATSHRIWRTGFEPLRFETIPSTPNRQA
jgi:hypothetical protein